MLQNNKVQEVTLISAKNKVNNKNDEDRAYDIEADVTSTVADVTAIEAGTVFDKETHVSIANFNEHQGGNDSISFTGQIPSADKRAISNAVYDFVDSVRSMYANPNNE